MLSATIGTYPATKPVQGQGPSVSTEPETAEAASPSREAVAGLMKSIRSTAVSIASSLWSPAKKTAASKSAPTVLEMGGAVLWKMGAVGVDDASKKFALGAMTEKSPDDLDNYGEHFLSRFWRPETGRALIHNRDHLDTLDPNKPLAVVVYPTADHNKAFEVGGFPLLDTLTVSGKFNVLYYEAESVTEVRKILDDVTEKSGRKIHTLILGGHGSATSLALGTSSCAKESDKCLSPDTFAYGDPRYGIESLRLERYIDLAGQVVLDSCSTGQGGAANPGSLANAAAASLPGRRIYAAEVSGNYKSFAVKDDLSLDIVWSGEGETSKMYVATAEKVEAYRKLEGIKKTLEGWAKRLKDNAGKEAVNPGTTAQGAPYSRFALHFLNEKKLVMKALDCKDLPGDEAAAAALVRKEIDAFLKRNPGWTPGAVFEYTGGIMGWEHAAQIRSLYLDGHPKDDGFLRSRWAALYLPSNEAAKAFPGWKGK